MNKLIIIGNGFDLAHGLKTKYSDMITFFWESFIEDCQELVNSPNYVFQNNFYRIEKRSNSFFDFRQFKRENGLEKTLNIIDPYFKYLILNDFLENIININNINTWVDVENEYYKNVISHLETSKKHGKTFFIRELNKSFEDIKKLLENHLLNEIKKSLKPNTAVVQKILRNPAQDELLSDKVSTSVNNILIVNFNYTDVIEKVYFRDLRDIAARSFCSVSLMHIHGDINDFKSNPMIFGYGDELDRRSKEIVDFNDSEFLKNIKSINYQFSSNYKRILQFLSQDKFQAVIMGHSCGNSDRTLLNTIFEHDNCISIKPYYHAWDGGDNYFDIVCNIYRNFTKNYSFREKVVEKNLCETLT